MQVLVFTVDNLFEQNGTRSAHASYCLELGLWYVPHVVGTRFVQPELRAALVLAAIAERHSNVRISPEQIPNPEQSVFDFVFVHI